MIKSRLLLTVAAFAMLPVVAVAQSVSGVATIGYGASNISGIDQGLDTLSVGASGELDMGNGLSFGLNLTGASVGIDGVPFDVTALMFGLDVNYAFANGFSVGSYIENSTFSADLLPYDLTLKSFGINAGYETGNLEVGGFAGISETSPDVGLMGIDIRDIGVTAQFAVSSQALVGGSFVRTTLSGGGDSVDVDSIGLAGSYAFSNGWGVFGGVSRTSADLGSSEDITSVGLGATYDISNTLSVPASLSLEFARSTTSLADESMDTVRLGITFPYGKAGKALPLNSVASAVLNPRGSAVLNTLLVAF